jgi:hypothetical protein
MIETLISIFEKVISTLSWLIKKARRPRIAGQRAPIDIFEQCGPGTSIERMKEVLGAPNKTSGNQFGYKFSDALVQIESKDGISISALGVVLPRKKWRTTFQVYPHPLKLILGKATLGDVLEEETEVKWESSSKEYVLYMNTGYGFPGLYRGFTFGVIHAPFVSGADYKRDRHSGRLTTDPKRIPLNWAAVSLSSKEAVLFNYWLFL